MMGTEGFFLVGQTVTIFSSYDSRFVMEGSP